MTPPKTARNARIVKQLLSKFDFDWHDLAFLLFSVGFFATFALLMFIVLPKVEAAYTCEDVSEEFMFFTATAEAPEWCEYVQRED